VVVAVVEAVWLIFSDNFLVAVAVVVEVILLEVSVDSEVYSVVQWVEEVEIDDVKATM
jgi:hypothetical protein